MTALIYNLKTVWPIKISMPFLSSLNIFYKMHNLFFKKICWLFWDRAQNMLIFGRRCSIPVRYSYCKFGKIFSAQRNINNMIKWCHCNISQWFLGMVRHLLLGHPNPDQTDIFSSKYCSCWKLERSFLRGFFLPSFSFL